MKFYFFLLILLIIPFVNAEKITWLDDCRYKCVDGKCNGVIGQTIYVPEGNTCIPREEAKSLKGTNLYLEIIEDKDYPVTCSDWNWTHRLCDFSSLELNKDIPLGVGNFDGESLVVDNSINLKFNSLSDKQSYWIEAENKIIKFGDTSTLVQLQDADTENKEDVYFENRSGGGAGSDTALRINNLAIPQLRETFVKFNISSIPTGSIELSGDLGLFMAIDNEEPGEKIKIYYVAVQGWGEDDLSPPDAVNLTVELEQGVDYGGSSTWLIVNVTDNIYSDLNNLSWKINKSVGTSDIRINSKEHASTALIPYLNVSFTIPPDTCSYTSGDWNIDLDDNCEIDSNVLGDGSDLYTYGTGSLTLNANITGFANYNLHGSGKVSCMGGCFK